MRHTFTLGRWILDPAGSTCLMIVALLLLMTATDAHAASIYRCVDAQGHLGFRDTPCGAHAQQSKISLQALPFLGAPRKPVVRDNPAPRHRTSSRSHLRTASARHKETAMSWECRAADGEVFYRHAHCPSSIPGDGVVRSDYANSMSSRYPNRRHNAWSRVKVHGVRIPRTAACRRIHAAGAAGRDGHQRDATVSTYDHLMGRDPCGDS